MRLNLALQGGGAHGAFTWGVLDRLLEEPKLEIIGISGTSAGAMNGAALKCGFAENGAEGAKAKLREYWETIGRYSTSANYQDGVFSLAGPFAGIWKENFNQIAITPTLDQLDSYWSPYSGNPFDFNALRNIVHQIFPKDLLGGKKGPKLFVNATNVRSGKIKVFKDKELTREALLASAALPSVFKAVEIEGEAYWDGGYTGNPALFPLIDHTDCLDIVIVHINPLYREKLPRTPTDIENRVNEITFNTSLLRELRQIEFITKWMDKNGHSDTHFKKLRIHSISDDDLMNDLSATSKLFASEKLIGRLYDAGRVRADEFLTANKSKIGKKSSLNLTQMFQSF